MLSNDISSTILDTTIWPFIIKAGRAAKPESKEGGELRPHNQSSIIDARNGNKIHHPTM